MLYKIRCAIGNAIVDYLWWYRVNILKNDRPLKLRYFSTEGEFTVNTEPSWDFVGREIQGLVVPCIWNLWAPDTLMYFEYEILLDNRYYSYKKATFYLTVFGEYRRRQVEYFYRNTDRKKSYTRYRKTGKCYIKINWEFDSTGEMLTYDLKDNLVETVEVKLYDGHGFAINWFGKTKLKTRFICNGVDITHEVKEEFGDLNNLTDAEKCYLKLKYLD